MSDKFRWAAQDGAAGVCINTSVYELASTVSYRVKMNFGKLEKARRERLLKALRLGFTTTYEDQGFMQALGKRFSCIVGFIGKTQAGLLLADDMTSEAIHDVMERIKATAMMAGIGKEIRVAPAKLGSRKAISVHVNSHMIAHDEPLTYKQRKAVQLTSRLEFLKPIAGELGAMTFPERRMMYAAIESGQEFLLEFEGPAPEYKKHRRKRK